MNQLLSTNYDEKLKKAISHFYNYPEMLPFIGKKWEESKRILLIGESHYLPYDEIKTYSDFDYYTNWYDGKSSGLNPNHSSYITTRNNLIKVEEGKYEKPLALYFNLKSTLKEIDEHNFGSIVFDKFSFYNYFQKPASVMEIDNEDRSIKANDFDEKFAYDTLKKLIQVIEPKFIIFVSKKSYDAFSRSKSIDDNFNDITIDFVPHAGRQWWNRPAKEYGDRTGREKFIDLIKEIYLS